MQFQAGVAQFQPVQAALDHFQRGLFLRHEEYAPAATDGLGDDVGNCLRFSCTRRPLDDEVAALVHVEDRQRLGAVRVHDGVGVGGRDGLVELVLRPVAGLLLAEPAAEQGLHQGVLAGLLPLGPALLVQVFEHQELAEGEEAEGHRRCVHGPPLLATDGGLHLGAVGGDIEFVGLGEFGERDAEVLAQERRQRQVLADLLVAVGQVERGAGVASVDVRRAPGSAGIGAAPGCCPPRTTSACRGRGRGC